MVPDDVHEGALLFPSPGPFRVLFLNYLFCSHRHVRPRSGSASPVLPPSQTSARRRSSLVVSVVVGEPGVVAVGHTHSPDHTHRTLHSHLRHSTLHAALAALEGVPGSAPQNEGCLIRAGGVRDGWVVVQRVLEKRRDAGGEVDILHGHTRVLFVCLW